LLRARRTNITSLQDRDSAAGPEDPGSTEGLYDRWFTTLALVVAIVGVAYFMHDQLALVWKLVATALGR